MKVAKDKARKLSTVQKIMLRSTDYLRRIIVPAGGQGGVTLSYLCQHSNSFPLEDYVWCVSAVPQDLCENLINALNHSNFLRSLPGISHVSHLKSLMEVYHWQNEQGRWFLHEDPRHS